ncbi:hypothetical protein [Roseobacter insulae]|nr:hypothetical protein [Roseobacter insulae]
MPGFIFSGLCAMAAVPQFYTGNEIAGVAFAALAAVPWFRG